MTDTRHDPAGTTPVEYRHGNYVTHHDWEGDQGLTTTITETLEVIPEVTVEEGEPLYETVDVDALESLCHGGKTSRDVEVRFSFQGCAILVSGDGTVRIQPARPPYQSEGVPGP